jgi:hypothetical protein
MAARYAWVLNLDADLELAAIAAGHTYAPKRSVLEAMRVFVPILTASLLEPHRDLVIDADSLEDADAARNAARRLVGRAFCPTPRALRILERAGAAPEAHPTIAALGRANSRAFATSLGTTLPGASFVTTLEEARAKLATTPPPSLAAAWRIKRNFGMTGRGQRIVAAAPLAPDLAFINAGLVEGGVQIEPDVTIVDEYGIHGLLDSSGSVRLGAVVVQRCDARGAWLSTERLASDRLSSGDPSSVLADEAARVAAALHAAGYFGPFGVDAFTYRDRDRDRENAIHLQPRSEINARYSMGFGVGMGSAVT